MSELITAASMYGKSENCASSPCLNGGTCADGLDMFTCTCSAEYQGTTCAIGECSFACCKRLTRQAAYLKVTTLQASYFKRVEITMFCLQL